MACFEIPRGLRKITGNFSQDACLLDEIKQSVKHSAAEVFGNKYTKFSLGNTIQAYITLTPCGRGILNN
jgi:hypothetical protein